MNAIVKRGLELAESMTRQQQKAMFARRRMPSKSMGEIASKYLGAQTQNTRSPAGIGAFAIHQSGKIISAESGYHYDFGLGRYDHSGAIKVGSNVDRETHAAIKADVEKEADARGHIFDERYGSNYSTYSIRPIKASE